MANSSAAPTTSFHNLIWTQPLTFGMLNNFNTLFISLKFTIMAENYPPCTLSSNHRTRCRHLCQIILAWRKGIMIKPDITGYRSLQKRMWCSYNVNIVMVPFTRRRDLRWSVIRVMAARELLQSETRSLYCNGECPYIWWHWYKRFCILLVCAMQSQYLDRKFHYHFDDIQCSVCNDLFHNLNSYFTSQ